MSRVLFIGGPGNISVSAVEELLARGYEYRLVRAWAEAKGQCAP